MQNLKTDKLFKLVYQELRNYIIANKLSAGDKLPPEMELCERLGVSRNVLRESLKALEIMNIVNPVPGIGYVVQTFSFDSIYENIFFHLLPTSNTLLAEMGQIRGAMELHFFDEAFDSLTPEDIVELGHKADEMEAAILSGKRVIREDCEFHNIIFRKISNSMFHSIERVTWDIHSRMTYRADASYTEFMLDSIKYHKNMYLAIKAGDREAAKKHLADHFQHPVIHIKNWCAEGESI